MFSVELAFLAFGAAATVLFFVGYARGVKIALEVYDDDSVEVDSSGDIENFWIYIALAVLASAALIGLVGVSPFFVYVGPFLAIVTAAMNGVAFFLDKGR